MKKIIILLFAIVSLALFSCSDSEQVTTPITSAFEMDTLQYFLMLNDINWIEITDITELETIPPCIYFELMKNGVVVNNEFQLYKLWTESKPFFLGIDTNKPCVRNYISSDINYTQKTLLGIFLGFYPSKIVHKFFVNQSLKKYRYIVEYHQLNWTRLGFASENWITIAKLNSEYDIDFVHVKFWLTI